MKDREFRSVLGKMGFTSGGVFEAILTTMNPDMSFNVAPMGVYVTGSSELELKPFKSSTTYENLLIHPKACINITDDPGQFFLTAFKGQILEDYPIPKIDDEMRLTTSLAHIFIEVERAPDVSDIRACFSSRIKDIETPVTIPRAFSRGRAEVIEAIVHATRIDHFTRDGRLEDVEKLIKRFDECKEVVERVSAPTSVESRIIGALEEMIAKWRSRI